MALKFELAEELKRKRGNGRVGKRIADFMYMENGQHFKWHIKLAKTSDIDYAYGEKMIYVVNEILPNHEQVVVVGQEAEEVRVEFLRRLKDLFQLDWKRVIGLHVSDENDRFGNYSRGTGVSLNYSFYQVATKTDGAKVYREWRNNRQSANATIHAGEPLGVVIPYTDETVEKLDSISDAINKLRSNLGALLSQDNIIKTLADVRVLGLPAPADT